MSEADYLSLNEVAGRAADLIAMRLGDPPVRKTSSRHAFAIELSQGRLIIAATDALLLTADARTEARRLVAQSAVPTAIVTLYRPWHGVWSADSAAHVAYLQPGAMLASEIINTRLALDATSVALVAEDSSRALCIDRDGWALMSVPPKGDALRRARDEAMGAWQWWVADPAGVR